MNKSTIKTMAVFAGSLILSGTISYSAISNVYEVKPFTTNNYAIYKVDLKEYRKNGVKNKPYYSKRGDFNENILTNSIFVKTPYYTDDNGDIRRDIYTYNISNLSPNDINFIIENTENLDLILSQDYMKKIDEALSTDYSLLQKVSGLSYINSEFANMIPHNNETEIYYAEYDTTSHEIIYYNSKYLDDLLDTSYVFSNILIAGIISKIYNILENKKKMKIKKNDN